MRKLTFTLAVLAILTNAFGQEVLIIDEQIPIGLNSSKIYEKPQSNLKGEGDVFYRETFDWADPSNPRGWSLPEGWTVTDDLDLGHFWEWRAGSDSIRGQYTFEPGHIYSESPEDGYLVFPVDEQNYIDGVSDLKAGSVRIQLPPIDCSDKSSVILKFNQNFRIFGTRELFCRVSGDGGNRWADIPVTFGTPMGKYCIKPHVELNISAIAAGSSEVVIQFFWDNNWAYFWCIDDIELSEGYVNDLVMEDQWLYTYDLEKVENEGFIYMLPLSKTVSENFGGYHFAGAMLNSGIDEQYNSYLEVEIFKNGNSVYNEKSEEVAIWPLDRDTLEIASPFFPDDYGDYKVVMSLKLDQEDGTPENNIYNDSFHVTDSIFSYTDFESEGNVSTAQYYRGNKDGDVTGVVINVSSNIEVNSISTYLYHNLSRPGISTRAGMSFMYVLYKWIEEEEYYHKIMTSTMTDVTEDMLNSWVTVSFEKDGETEFLSPGTYIAGIETYHHGGEAPDSDTHRFTIGSDVSHKFNMDKSVCYFYEHWTEYTEMAMVQLNFNNSEGPAEAEVVFNIDMNQAKAEGAFAASSDFVDIAGSFNGWNGADHHMEDTDGDGIYTLAIAGFSIWQNFEYKYRINGNWNTSEFPDGGPNRVYRSTYYNVLDDVYNNGLGTMGIETSSIINSIKVYPNPTEGFVNLEVGNVRPIDIKITVAAINGQVVYQNLIQSTINHSERIDLSGFGKGIYFVRINDTVRKLVVK